MKNLFFLVFFTVMLLGCDNKKESTSSVVLPDDIITQQEISEIAIADDDTPSPSSSPAPSAPPPSVYVSTGYSFEQNFARNDIAKIIREDDMWGYTFEILPNIGFSSGKRVIYNGSIALLNFIIPDSALAILNKDELRLLRNIIYAKHGMIFQSNDLTAHFQQFNWYNPQNRNVDGLLTDNDKINIQNIQIFENAVPNHNVTKSDLVIGRNYNEWFPLPSWSPELEINDDNTIQKHRWDSEDNWKGTYRIENGFLVVNVTEQMVSDYYSKLSSWQWPSGATYNDGVIKYSVPIRLVFPIEDITELYFDDGFHVEKRRIGSTNWF